MTETFLKEPRKLAKNFNNEGTENWHSDVSQSNMVDDAFAKIPCRPSVQQILPISKGFQRIYHDFSNRKSSSIHRCFPYRGIRNSLLLANILFWLEHAARIETARVGYNIVCDAARPRNEFGSCHDFSFKAVIPETCRLFYLLIDSTRIYISYKKYWHDIYMPVSYVQVY